ncbi:DUF488 family protein [Nocardia sp. NPDC023852]|uniref:DUF488 family protein n=1 Tax=Nocardia sp. NPDC023852 TaxID=3154697 RepID=UPI0033CACB1E
MAQSADPSNELRRWFPADRDARGGAFVRRYRAELAASAIRQHLRELRALAAENPVICVHSRTKYGAQPCSCAARHAAPSPRTAPVYDKFTDMCTCPRARKRGSKVASCMRAAAVWLVREVLTVTELLSTRGPAPGPRGA